MGAVKQLGSREIRGVFTRRMEEVLIASWVSLIAHDLDSDSEKELYKWASQSPAMREWLGTRKQHQPRVYKQTVVNRKFENTITVDVDDLRRDKTGEIMRKIGQLATRAAQLPQKLLSELILNNATAFDGLALYANRSTGGIKTGGQIDNDVGAAAATAAKPTEQEVHDAILASIEVMVGALDDASEPMNQDALQFAVMIPPNMVGSTMGALKNEFTSTGRSNTLQSTTYQVTPIVNPRLKSANTKFHTFRTDGDLRSLIWQEELATQFSSKAEGSDYEHDNDAHEYGAKRIGEVATGEPSTTVRTTFS